MGRSKRQAVTKRVKKTKKKVVKAKRKAPPSRHVKLPEDPFTPHGGDPLIQCPRCKVYAARRNYCPQCGKERD